MCKSRTVGSVLWIGLVWISLFGGHQVNGDQPDASCPSGNCSCGSTTVSWMTHEQRLFKCIFNGLDPHVRPAKRANITVEVVFNPMVIKVLDVDEKSHIMTTNGWLHHEWHDFQLTWKPEEFGGLQRVRIPIERIWTPDIVLFNNADESYQYVVDKLAIVTYQGKVIWVPHARLRSYCTLELRRFPFDSQECVLIFGSWTHDVTAVNITTSPDTKLEYMMETNEWVITNTSTKRYQWQYKDTEQYAGVIQKFAMKRVSSFYQYIFIMPTVIFAFLALLIPFINPMSKERITFSVALILGCTLILMILENHMPTEIGTVPVVAAYLCYLMVMLSISIFFSILVINMCFRDPRDGKVPGWMRWIFLTKLNKLVCVPMEPYTAIPADIAVEENTAERELLNIGNGTSNHNRAESKPSLERTMEDIRRYLRVCASKATMSEPSATHRELVVREWHQVAKVIDRLLFVSFLLLTIVITISMYSHY